MKYVTVNFNGKELALLFSRELNHRAVYEGARSEWVRDHHGRWECRVLGAGFVDVTLPSWSEVVRAGTQELHSVLEMTLRCGGNSESLNEVSRGDLDGQIIRKMLGS